MRKQSLITVLVTCIFILSFTNSIVFAEGQGYLPPDSLKPYQQGSSCDENPFSGMVVDSVLKKTSGKSSDCLELKYRKNKSQKYKVKRLHIDAGARMAFPVLLKDGGCARVYSSTPLTVPQLNQLLATNESLEPIFETEAGSKHKGSHYTTAIYLIRKH